MNNSLTPWVQFTTPAPDDRLRLLCFHHAGGGATFFRSWIPRLAAHGIDVWPVQLPGRENRFSEPWATDLAVLARTLTRFLAPRLNGQRYALYGHSAGAFVASAFAMRMTEIGLEGPRHLFVAAARPPGHPDPDAPIHRLATAPLLAKMRSYGGTPPEVFANADLVEMMLALVRADLRLVETARWRAGVWFDHPVTAIGGVTDPSVPVELLPYWRAVTSGPFEHTKVSGGHFPDPAATDQLLDLLVDSLEARRPA